MWSVDGHADCSLTLHSFIQVLLVAGTCFTRCAAVISCWSYYTHAHVPPPAYVVARAHVCVCVFKQWTCMLAEGSA